MSSGRDGQGGLAWNGKYGYLLEVLEGRRGGKRVGSGI